MHGKGKLKQEVLRIFNFQTYLVFVFAVPANYNFFILKNPLSMCTISFRIPNFLKVCETVIRFAGIGFDRYPVY